MFWRATTTSSRPPADARNPAAWTKDALFLPQTREKFRALTNLGLTDAIRAVSDARDLYTFWDYQAGAWAKDDGIRIDHLLLSPQAADRLIDAGIDRHVRSWDKPSDHVPVWIDLGYRGAVTRAVRSRGPSRPSRAWSSMCWSTDPADAPLVLLLHGFAESFHMWRAQLPALAAARISGDRAEPARLFCLARARITAETRELPIRPARSPTR